MQLFLSLFSIMTVRLSPGATRVFVGGCAPSILQTPKALAYDSCTKWHQEMSKNALRLRTS